KVDHDSLVDALWEFMDYPEPERDYRKALADIDDGSVTGDFEEFLAEHYSKVEETKNYLVRRVEYWHVQAVDEADAICNYAGGERNRLDEEAFAFTVKSDEDIKDAIW